jgi:hypothetical protein
MDDIYVLQGRSNSGKSETIRLLIYALLLKYPNATITSSIPNGIPPIPQRIVDVKIILSGIKNMVVGVESQGDPGSRLQQSLKDFVEATCDIIICTCRTRGMTVQWINSLASNYTLHYIPQNIANHNFTNNNQNMAQHIISLANL